MSTRRAQAYMYAAMAVSAGWAALGSSAERDEGQTAHLETKRCNVQEEYFYGTLKLTAPFWYLRILRKKFAPFFNAPLDFRISLINSGRVCERAESDQ